MSHPGPLNNPGWWSQEGGGAGRLVQAGCSETETRKLGQRKDVGEEGKVKSRGWAPGNLVGKTEKFKGAEKAGVPRWVPQALSSILSWCCNRVGNQPYRAPLGLAQGSGWPCQLVSSAAG